jgi:hypothetical protein
MVVFAATLAAKETGIGFLPVFLSELRGKSGSSNQEGSIQKVEVWSRQGSEQVRKRKLFPGMARERRYGHAG